MSFSKINFWIEGDISTTRVISRLLSDVVGQGNCSTKLIDSVSWKSLVSSRNIFCRVCDPDYHWLPAYLKKNGIPYVYYLDDNFWKITGSGDLARHYKSAAVVSALDEFVRGAAFVITHTQVMVDFITNRFPEVRCELLPVPFDVSLARTVENKPSFETRRSPVIGYAGSYKEAEFEFLEAVLARLGKERPEIRVEFIGGISDRLRCLNNVQWFPGFSDYATFLSFKISRNWTVGLAPLMDSEFNSAKTNNKFREYGGCHIPGLYSDTSPYIECINSEQSGLLVENVAETWVEAIKRLVDDQVLQERIKKEAFAFVDSNYSHRVIAPVWKAVIETIPECSGLQPFAALRFHYYKRYRLSGFADTASDFESGSIALMCKAILKRKFRSLLTRLAARRLVVMSVLVMLILVNFCILKAGLL